MEEKQYQAAKDRTDSKIRYTIIHLEELKHTDRSGDDFERAHQESFLFHYHGIREAYLQELNIKLEIGLPLEKVTLNNLVKNNVKSNALEKLVKLESDKSSWLSVSNEMRNHSTHRSSVPRVFFRGGKKNGQVNLSDTKTGEIIEKDYIILFELWCSKISDLIGELRKL